MVEAQEVEAISLECQECGSRVEMPAGWRAEGGNSHARAAESASRITRWWAPSGG